MLYRDTDFQRESELLSSNSKSNEYRSDFRRDYARLIHSSVFRRLQGKTQLFPGIESDFFRNRLTHSLEVAQIAKSIAIKLNKEEEFFGNPENQIDLDLVEVAGLAHDLGHPPFGHNGEIALDDHMKEFGGFEGNAQTLRILARLEKKELAKNESHNPPYGVGKDGNDYRIGLNLTYRTLASLLKYDSEIPIKREKNDLKKGYYKSETKLVKKIKKSVTGVENFSGKFKTIECQIMDIADDIAYSTYDLEDALKAGFLTPLDMISSEPDILDKISKKVKKNIGKDFTSEDVIKVILDIFISQKIFDLGSLGIKVKEKKDPTISINPYSIAELVSTIYKASIKLGTIGYLRTQLTSDLVDQFVNGVRLKEKNNDIVALSIIELEEDVRKKVEVLKHYTFESLIMSPKLKIIEYRGSPLKVNHNLLI